MTWGLVLVFDWELKGREGGVAPRSFLPDALSSLFVSDWWISSKEVPGADAGTPFGAWPSLVMNVYGHGNSSTVGGCVGLESSRFCSLNGGEVPPGVSLE